MRTATLARHLKRSIAALNLSLCGAAGDAERLGSSCSPPRHSERHDVITLSPVLAAADCDDDELFSPRLVRHRCCAGATRKSTSPKLSSRLDVERAEDVIHRGADEDQATCCDDRPAEVWRAGRCVWHAFQLGFHSCWLT